MQRRQQGQQFLMIIQTGTNKKQDHNPPTPPGNYVNVKPTVIHCTCS